MPELEQGIILRLGSHAEKEYFEKTIKFFSGIIIGANLFASKPGATGSLLMQKLLFQGGNEMPYIVDPMTYAFGDTIDRTSHEKLTDLDWLKSVQKKIGKRDFKDSYRQLANSYGELFIKAIDSSRSLCGKDIKASTIPELCERVVAYQENCLTNSLSGDECYREIVDELPAPSIVLTPYFHIDPTFTDFTLDQFLLIAAQTVKYAGIKPTYAVLSTSKELLVDTEKIRQVIIELQTTGVRGLAFWISQLNEHEANQSELNAMRTLVDNCRQNGLKSLNIHGGYFSLALSKFGLNNVSHGVGYGEVKDVVPVIGQATPTVQYYVPDLHRKVSVPLIESTFAGLNVATVEDFRLRICDCAICRGVVVSNIGDFSEFGGRHFATDESRRLSQTPAAAKRCRYHYLINRVREWETLKDESISSISEQLDKASSIWSHRPIVQTSIDHLRRWSNALA